MNIQSFKKYKINIYIARFSRTLLYVLNEEALDSHQLKKVIGVFFGSVCYVITFQTLQEQSLEHVGYSKTVLEYPCYFMRKTFALQVMGTMVGTTLWWLPIASQAMGFSNLVIAYCKSRPWAFQSHWLTNVGGISECRWHKCSGVSVNQDSLHSRFHIMVH